MYTQKDSEKNTIRIRLMPNIHDLRKNTEILKFYDLFNSHNKPPKYLYFSYILNKDNKIEIFKFGEHIRKILKSVFHGAYITPNGNILSSTDEEITSYFANEDFSINLPFHTDKHLRYGMNKREFIKDIKENYGDNYKEYKDFEKLDPINLYDIQSEYMIEYTVDSKNSLPHSFKLVKTEPLWKEGDDKDKILKLYDNVQTLEDYISEFKEKHSESGYVFKREDITESSHCLICGKLVDNNHINDLKCPNCKKDLVVIRKRKNDAVREILD